MNCGSSSSACLARFREHLPRRRRLSVRPALVDYFPPSEDQGGWRSLLPNRHEPVDAEKARIREVAGVDWDKLGEAWRLNEAAEGATGLVVIRHGYLVGEWYKDCDRHSAFNIYSSSKAYTSTAFGLILAEFGCRRGKAANPCRSRRKFATRNGFPSRFPCPIRGWQRSPCGKC